MLLPTVIRLDIPSKSSRMGKLPNLENHCKSLCIYPRNQTPVLQFEGVAENNYCPLYGKLWRRLQELQQLLQQRLIQDVVCLFYRQCEVCPCLRASPNTGDPG